MYARPFLILAVAALSAPALAQPAGPPRLDPAARAAQFAKADVNKDGQVTKEEWIASLPTASQANKDRLEAAWSRMDPDKTGHIGKDAFVNFTGAPRGVGSTKTRPAAHTKP
jgi:hypothetical protein